MARVQWGPAIGGAFIAFACATVLWLFGAAFGLGGLRVLSGIWEIVTPLVAVFIGGAFAARVSDRRSAFLNGILVWGMALAFTVLVFAVLSATNTSAGALSFVSSSSAMALSGLAAILGLIGGVLGAAIASAVSVKIAPTYAGAPAEPEREYHYRELDMPERRVEHQAGDTAQQPRDTTQHAGPEEHPLH